MSKSLWPLISRWVERSDAVPKNVIGVVQDFVSFLPPPPAPHVSSSIDSKVLKLFEPWASDVGSFINHGGRKEHVIIRNPELMQELSEAPELSQQAVYADVSSKDFRLKIYLNLTQWERFSGLNIP